MKTDNLEVFLEKVRGGKLALGCCVTLADAAVTEIAAAWRGLHGDQERHQCDAAWFRGDVEGGVAVKAGMKCGVALTLKAPAVLPLA